MTEAAIMDKLGQHGVVITILVVAYVVSFLIQVAVAAMQGVNILLLRKSLEATQVEVKELKDKSSAGDCTKHTLEIEQLKTGQTEMWRRIHEIEKR